MSLRWRLTGAFLLAVALAVLGGTVAHVAEVSRRLEDQLRYQAERIVSSVRTEMEQTGDVLDEELELALDPRGFFARSIGSGRIQARYLSAGSRLQTGRLEILKVLTVDGAILTSGHWPASFGALDPQIATYRQDPGTSARIVDEATPMGSAPSIQRWARGRWGGNEVIVVAGRFLGPEALERMRARVGADLLALCRPEARVGERIPCHTVKNAATLPDEPFTPDAPWAQNLVLQFVPLGAGKDPPILIAGLDRSSIDQVRQAMVQRALLVGALSIALAMALGVFLATRIVRPIEALAAAAGRLADGDLSTRVDAEMGGGREVRDLIDAFNRMAADIERSQTKLKQAERVAAWREIAKGLAHELKNPLTPILGAMDVIRRARFLGRDDFDDILKEQSDAVVEEVMRLKELADAFSRFARLPDPKPEPLQLPSLVDHAVALYAGEETEIEVERRYEPGLPKMVADRTQVMTVVTNLVKNAVEAMEGKGRLTVTLRKVTNPEPEEAPQIEICIEDSGPGIAPEIQDRLFTPYVTTKGSRGTGLGLALVHRIVMEHGGGIEVGKGRDGGASFSIRLPLEQKGAAA